MELDELIATYRSRKKPRKTGLTDKEYRRHYPLVRDAVRSGVPLLAAVKIIRKAEGAFEGRTDKAVAQAFYRELDREGIAVKEAKSGKRECEKQ